jgi:mannose-6-phosphate isomerase
MALNPMTALYPLKFVPQFEYRPWGGRRLAGLVSAPLPDASPVGEAWLLSDRAMHASVVADGPLRGTRLRQLLDQCALALLGPQALAAARFPLLLKFLDVTGTLSVQVHPAGKTEAWVVIAAGNDARVYAGLKPATTAPMLRAAIADGSVTGHLVSFVPRVGEAILIPAGTVHCLHDVLVFEVQENCDVTFRLHDWNRIDDRTHALRPLQVEQALQSIHFAEAPAVPAVPVVECAAPIRRERLLDSPFFGVARVHAGTSFMVGAVAAPRILVCLEGRGNVMHADEAWSLSRGDTMVLPAGIGVCRCVPEPNLTLLEVSLPQRVAP